MHMDDEPNTRHSLQKIGERLLKRLDVNVILHPMREENEDDECEFDIRMTDVPEDVLANHTEPDILEVRLGTFGKRVWQRTPRKRFVASLLLVTLLTILVGISSFEHTLLSLVPSLSTTPQSKDTMYIKPSDTLASSIPATEANFLTLGPNHSVVVTARTLPTYCPTGTVLGQGKQVGNFPVWLAGINDTAIIHLPPITLKTVKGWKGWVVPLRLSGKYHYITNFTLTVFNVDGLTSPLFQDPYTNVVNSQLFINLQRPMHIIGTSSERQIGTWDILLYLPSAGCYAIGGAWDRGNWVIHFAAGQ